MIVERFTATPVGALTLVDEFARLRGTRGSFPPLAGRVRFKLVEQISGDVSTRLDPPISLQAEVSPSGVYLFDNEVTIGSSKGLRFPAGRFRLRIESDFYQTLEPVIDFPPDLANMPVLNLKPGPAYPFPNLTVGQNALTLLYGSLFEIGEGRPIEGAVVTLVEAVEDYPFKHCRTGSNGDWVMVIAVGASEGPLLVITLEFKLPDGSSFNVPNLQLQTGTVNSLRQTALRGRVLNATGAPISGATITVSVQPGESMSEADGQWFFYLDLLQPDAQARVTARAPNGSTQEQDVLIRNRSTVVVPPFHIATN